MCVRKHSILGSDYTEVPLLYSRFWISGVGYRDTLTSDDRQTSKSDQVLARFRAMQESIINTAYHSTVDIRIRFKYIMYVV